MPRDLPLGNGSVLIAFDCDYQPRDIYYPHVGSENHAADQPFRTGIWVDGVFRWVTRRDFGMSLDYRGATLVTDVEAHSEELAVKLVFNDAVDFHENAFVRRITIHNESDEEREVRLFLCHDFNIYGTEIGDTAYYDPATLSVIHYKGERWFLMGGCDAVKCGIDQFATGISGRAGAEGTWRDCEDGELSCNPIAQGAVDSVVALHFKVPANGSMVGSYWMAIGESYEDVALLNKIIHGKTPDELIKRTGNYWNLWVNKEHLQFGNLPEDCVRLFKRSLLVVRTQVDHEGGILAANDSDITPYSSDTYSYVWPRDGALVSTTLARAGYPVLARDFFDFCARVVTDDGYLMHKYNANGSLASSWHPLVVNGNLQLPIQEDETALVLWAMWEHYRTYRDIEFVKHLYRPLVIRCGQFLAKYRRTSTGLPRPSWDLWEERWGVHAFTCAAVYGGLMASCSFADAFGETRFANEFRQAANEIREGLVQHLYNEEVGRFARSATETENDYDLDMTVDSSLAGLFLFGVFSADDPRVISTMLAVRDRLTVPTSTGGIARYERDAYQRPSEAGDEIPGNPWFISTLWFARWQIARARTAEDLQEVVRIFEWAAQRALKSGILAEQVHPYTQSPLSVSPLTWSHSAYVATVLDYLEAMEKLDICEACGAPKSPVRPRII